MNSPSAIWSHCLEYAALSNVGLRRANNQDAMAVIVAESQETWLRRGHLFMVADGMGAHAAGELASKLATDTVPLIYYKLLDRSPPEAILTAVRDTNAQIHGRGQASLDFKGMGTTATTLLLLPQGVLVAHVGDSRAYRLRGDRLEQLTFDHSLIWEMRAAGQLPEDAAAAAIPKNIITRSLGPNATVQVDLEGPFPLAIGDTFLLCSDGLSGQVKDEEIAAVLQAMPPGEAVHALIDLANLRGGPDNITVVVVRVTGQIGAQQADGSAPAATSTTSARPVNPLVWTLLGVSALGALGLALAGYSLTALVCLAVAVVAGVAVLVQRYGGGEDGRFELDGRLLGRGPYRAAVASMDGEFTSYLMSVLDQLRDGAIAENWAVDWSRFNGLQKQFIAAKQSGDFAQAVRLSLHAVRFMLEQLRQQRELDRQKAAGQ